MQANARSTGIETEFHERERRESEEDATTGTIGTTEAIVGITTHGSTTEPGPVDMKTMPLPTQERTAGDTTTQLIVQLTTEVSTTEPIVEMTTLGR